MKFKLLLFLIFVLGFASRIYGLTDYPDGVHIDEASYAYNAYSILKTGKDQFGKTLPIFFESESDYKQPVHIYLSTIAVGIFGLNRFGSRFTAFFLSTIAVFLIYKITSIITNSKKTALLSAFILSISPWHFLFSRTATDVMTASTFCLFALLFYLYYVKKSNLKNFLLFFVFSLLSIFAYRTTTIFVLLFFPIVEIIRTGNFFLKEKKSAVVLISGLVLFIIFLTFLSFQLKRYSSVSFVSNDEIKILNGQNVREDGIFNRPINNLFVTRIFHNKIIDSLIIISRNYISQFDLSFLFIKGDGSLNDLIPGVGNLYSFEVLMLFVFLIYFFKVHSQNKFVFIPLLWILISNVPSSLTTDAVNSSRSFQAVLGYAVILAIGFSLILDISRVAIYKQLISILFLGLYAFGFSFMLHQFFIHKNLRMPWYRNSKVEKMASYIEQNKYKYNKVIFGNDLYTLYAFGVKLDPAILQARIKNDQSSNKNKLIMKNLDDKFATDGNNCDFQEGELNVLYVCFGNRVPRKSDILQIYRYKDEGPAYILITYNPNKNWEINPLPESVEYY